MVNARLPIHADTAQMQYGGRAKQNIISVEDVTHSPAENPLARDLHAGVEGHH